MTSRTSYTLPLTPSQQAALIAHLRSGNYRPLHVPHARAAAEGWDCRIALYESGKCLVQGRGAEDWVTFVLEPQILREARLGYDDVLRPESAQPHMGVDESGKGDFFGPLVIAAAYTDETLAARFRELDVRDSKRIASDRKAEELAQSLRRLLGRRYAVVVIGPRRYNELYARIRNVNRLLAWGHARAIENLLEQVPSCPRAVADQFGPTRQIEQALLKKGRRIRLEQRPRAESDPAVAAASVLARAAFLAALRNLRKKYDLPLPKGASTPVRDAAKKLVAKAGPDILLEVAKCHFRTTDAVLQELGLDRHALGPVGLVTSKARETEREALSDSEP